MKNPAVTVIVAMFNAQDFIADCLTSLLNQTFQDFEVIVADDCSTDSSRAVVQKFSADFDGRLKLLTLCANSGHPGVPRNFALEAARGKYVCFLDSDDLLSETALEDFFCFAESFNADVVHAEKYVDFTVAGGQLQAEVMSMQTGEFVTAPTLETFDIGRRVTDFTRKRYMWQAWGKLFRRQFLVDNKIEFPATKTFEDFVFAFKCLVTAKNYVRVPFVSYHYRAHENSISRRDEGLVKFFDNVTDVVKSLDDFMSGRKFFVDNPQYRYALIDFFMRERLGNFAQETFINQGYDPGEVYDFFCTHVFSRRPQDNVALTAYLFVAANIFKLDSTRQPFASNKREVSN